MTREPARPDDAPLRLVYFGSGGFGLPTFERLTETHDVRLVVTQPDRPAGRGRRLRPTPIAEAAGRVQVLKPHDVNAPEVVARVHAAPADAYVVIAFGQKLGETLLGRTPAMNLHGSLLPKYRGAAPIQWAMINGEVETGVSVITLAQRMDAGRVLGTRAVAIDPHETAGELHDRLAALGPDVILAALRRLREGRLEEGAADQDEALATRAPKLTKADGTVRFDQPADRVRARVHGLTPWPGCWVRLADRELRLERVAVVDDAASGAPPGTILDDGTVACRPGRIEVRRVHPAGGRAMCFEDFRRGHRMAPGVRLRPRAEAGS